MQEVKRTAWQTYVLTLLFWSERKGAWKTSLVNALYPLYPIVLLVLFLNLEILPFSLDQLPSRPLDPPLSLLELSSPAIDSWRAFPQQLAFGPESDAEAMELAKGVTEQLGIDFENVTLIEDQDEFVNGWLSGLSAAVYIESNAVTIAHPPLPELSLILSETSEESVNPQDALLYSGIVYLQALIMKSVTLYQNVSTSFEFSVQALPVKEKVVLDNFLSFIFPIFFIDAVFFNLRSLLIEVSLQAERGFRQALILKGLNRKSIWFSAFLNHGAFTMIPSTLLPAGLYATRILVRMPPAQVFLVFWLNGLAQTAFGILVLTIAGDKVKSKTVFTFGVVLFVLFNVVFYAFEFGIYPNVDNDPLKRSFFLLYVAAFGHILFNIPEAELLGTGLNETIDPNIWWAFVILAIDIVLYFILALLVDSFREWRKYRKIEGRNAVTEASVDSDLDNKVMTDGVHVRGISVKFRKKFAWFWSKKEYFNAVDSLELDIPKNEIFCLLGQNGAGKTTLLNVLIGNTIPYKGDAWVHGYHVIRDRALLRQNIGVCPQHDIVLDYIPCIDQLITQARIAGMNLEDSLNEANRLLERLDLKWKAKQMPINLSGGQKRRLTLALALIGSPDIVILDEPTTGLDPSIRKTIWELLNSLKGEHTILMTTHSLEEADVLSDKIAIMNKGRIQDIGTSLQLKERHGPGYKLNIVRSNYFAGQQEEIQETVTKHIPQAKYSEIQSSGAEMTFVLPLNSTNAFPILFESLEKNTAQLGLSSFGVAPSTLEDVFISLDKAHYSFILINCNDDSRQVEIRVTLDETIGSLKEKIAVEFDTDPGYQVLKFKNKELKDESTTLKDYDIENGCKIEMEIIGDRNLNEINTSDDAMYKRSILTQFKAVLIQVVLGMARNPGIWLMLVIFPIVLTIAYNYLTVFLDGLAQDPSPIELSISDLFDGNDFLVHGNGSIANSFGNDLIGLNVTSNFSDETEFYKVLLNKSYLGAWYFTDVENTGNNQTRVEVTIVYERGPEASIDLLGTRSSSNLWYATSAMVQSVYSGLLSDENTTSENLVGLAYLEWKPEGSINSLVGGGGASYLLAVIFGLQTSIIAVEMMLIRTRKTKDFLLISGMPKWLFWVCYYVAHSVIMAIPCFVVLVVLVSFEAGGTAESSIFAFVLLFVFYIGPAVTLGYIISFVFNDEEIAENFSSEFVILTFTIPWAALTFGSATSTVALENLISFLIPTYALYRGFALLQIGGIDQQGYDFVDIFDWNLQLVQTYICLLASLCFYAIIILIVESNIFKKIKTRRSNAIIAKNSNYTAKKVAGEEEYTEDEVNINYVLDGILPPPISAIPKGIAKEDLLIECSGVNKSFLLQDKSIFKAVQNASLGVQKNTIFGLLGPNGAGKTTLIKCLTGSDGYVMDSGSATIFGYSVLNERKNILPLMGLCPQHDILINLLTRRELLTMFARIRGVPNKQIPPLVNYYLKMLDLTPKANSRCKNYSGGNRRRLSVALSMIGSPSAIFMDEPSTGLDPLTRRRLWEFLLEATRKEQSRERSILLTTHSMEEADALCNRIAIMVNSSIRTVGTSQELKAKYGTDRIVVLGVDKEADIDRIDDFIESIHSGAKKLKESSSRVRKYSIPSVGVTWSRIFKTIMDNQSALEIHNFSVSQRSLEDVFIDFANLSKSKEEIQKENLETMALKVEPLE